MRKELFILFLLLIFGCSETHRVQKMAKALGKCENTWQYFKLAQPIKGIVLLYTPGHCGYFHIHANTIIIINNADTIRVDGPCYTKNINPSDSILVNTYESDNAKGAVGDGKYDCTIKKTCYGIITKIK